MEQLKFELDMEPAKMAEMAFRETDKFMKVCKENGITRFSHMHGFDAELEGLKGKNGTKYWTPMLMALATGKMELAQFIKTHSIESFDKLI
jgi:hypothetical protein